MKSKKELPCPSKHMSSYGKISETRELLVTFVVAGCVLVKRLLIYEKSANKTSHESTEGYDCVINCKILKVCLTILRHQVLKDSLQENIYSFTFRIDNLSI